MPKTTMHGVQIPTAEEELHALDEQIRTAIDALWIEIQQRKSCDRANIAGWKLRNLLARWNAAMNRWKLEGNSEGEYFTRKADNACTG